jgi:putative hydrolase of the HAD superfamily
MNQRTTVIFDFGGVITSSPFEAFNRMEAERELPHNLVRRINSANPDGNAWALFERAEIDAARFDGLFAEEAKAIGYDLPGRDVLALLSGDIRPGMVVALDWLKANGYRIGCITNNVPAGHGAQMSSTAEKAEAIRAIMARFDHVVESSKVGIRKPDPAIYRLACAALGVDPGECVYLDDLGINCKPAAALGMAAIKVTSGDQALGDLEIALGLAPGTLPAA